MKRRTYRQAKKELEREKKQKNQNTVNNSPSDAQKSQVPQTTFSQDTAEFDVQSFSDESVPEEIYQDLDTNEIFFERQKAKQYLWSGPGNHSRKVWVWIILIIAVLAILFLGPTVFNFFKTIFR